MNMSDDEKKLSDDEKKLLGWRACPNNRCGSGNKLIPPQQEVCEECISKFEAV